MLTTVLLCCAFIGGAILVVQLVMAALAMGAGHGLHLHHHHGGGGRMLGHRGGPRMLKGMPSHGVKHAAAVTHAPAGMTHVHGDGHSGAGMHWAVSLLWGMLNFQALVAGIAAFGLSGLAAVAAGLATAFVLSIGIGTAFVIMLGVAAIFHLMLNMDEDGTLRLEDAVGAMGTVYLSIPANNGGQGKVTVTLQQRHVEFAAVTLQERPLAAGEKIIVVNVLKPSVMEVVPAEKFLAETSA
jgi:hypothetical protein